jgi:hypothetical protein
VRLVAPLALVALVLSGCGGSSPPAPKADLSSARAATTAAGTAQFKLTITAVVAGSTIRAEENGTASFARRRAHLYKQLPGSAVPQELVLIGPFTYTNANVQAALNDPTVKPWTKLDTRRLTTAQKRRQPDELAHVLAPAYLADGVAAPTRVGRDADGTTHFTGLVDPTRLSSRVSAAILTAVRNDYTSKPFQTDFWVDDHGRVRRVLVDYTTPQGSKITLDTTYSEFGVGIDVKLPAPGEIADITPK